MDYRKIFDNNVSPEDFDKWRSRYCDELFADIIEHSKLGSNKTALEIGPGTGQATEPILKTGCSYMAIELGENFTEDMKNKFGSYANFQIVNADFETYDFEKNKFDLVYSAATIQWIPEEIAFPKVYNILKNNGTLAMFMTHTDYKSPNEALYQKIQEVYDKYFIPETPYTRHLEYKNVMNYGFTGFECRHYHKVREYNADEFVSWTRIMAPQLTIQEPNKTKFLEGISDAVLSFGNSITLLDDIVLYLVRRP
ncbi:MAG: class I SAM-dependent methyltransferase [Lachnospiraceae bacterium]|jgi:ubiquinone/menaquinone biosynthesis C-methylase UbiE|nr:class I SAM-dependent methyltransferase [Lachnospiraceae bacterium]